MIEHQATHFMGGLPGDVSEEPVTQEKRKKCWRMSCDVGEVTESLENEQSSLSKLSVASPTSHILQPFRRFTYVTAHSPTLSLLHLRQISFSNPSFAFLRHRLFTYVTWRAAHDTFSVNVGLLCIIVFVFINFSQLTFYSLFTV